MTKERMNKIIRFAIYGLCSILFFFSFGLAGRRPYNYVNIGLWVVLAILFAFSHDWKKRWHPDLFFFINAFYLLVQLVSYVASGLKSFPQTTLVIGATSLMLYQILIEEKASKDRYFTIAGIGCAAFLVLFAIIYRNEIFHPNISSRIGSFFDNQNNVGRSLAIISILLFANGIRSKKRIFKVLWIIGAAASSYFLLLTGSVSAVLTLCFTAFVAIPLSFKKHRWVVLLLESGLVFVGITLLFSIPALSYYANRILGMLGSVGIVSGKSDLSFETRFKGAIVGFEIFLNAPLTGSGYNAVQTAFYVAAHNNFSEVLADFGIFGFLALESLFVIPMAYLLKSKKDGWLTPFSLLLFVFCFQFFLLMHNSKPDSLILTLCFAACFNGGCYPAFLKRKRIKMDRLKIK